MNKAEALDKIESLAYSYDRGKIESMREGIEKILDQYADEQSREAYEQGFKDGKAIQKGWEDLKDSGLDKPFNQQK